MNYARLMSCIDADVCQASKSMRMALAIFAMLTGMTAPLTCAAEPVAQAKPYYLTIGAGISSPSDWSYYDNSSRHNVSRQGDGVPARIAFGRRFSLLRAELEYAQARFDFGSQVRDGVVLLQLYGHEDREVYSLNGYYDFYSSTSLSAHVGAGIGQARVIWDIAGGSAPGILVQRMSGTVSAYRFILGFNYLIAPSWLLGMDYRREVTSDLTLVNVNGVPQTFAGKDQDSAMVNLTYQF